MGIKNLNKVLESYKLYTNVERIKLNEKEITYILVDVNCIFHQCTYNTLTYDSFKNKVIKYLNAPLIPKYSYKLILYLDVGSIEIKQKLREERNKHIKKHLKETDFLDFYNEKSIIIKKIIDSIIEYYRDNDKVNIEIIRTKDRDINVDAEYLMVMDAKYNYWPREIYPLFYSNDQDIVYLLARNQTRNSYIIKSNNTLYWILENNELTRKLAQLTIILEGNDYIKGLMGISAKILIKDRINEKENIYKYLHRVKKNQIAKYPPLEIHTLKDYQSDIQKVFNEITMYTSLTTDYYNHDKNIPSGITMLFVDYIRTFNS
jgi:hypothetical protein